MKEILLVLVITATMLNAQTARKKLAVELSSPRQAYAVGEDISITAKLCKQRI